MKQASEIVKENNLRGTLKFNLLLQKERIMFLGTAELVMKIAPQLLQLFVAVIMPIASQLLTFTLPRLARIPVYLQFLWTIYQDTELNAEARKYLTSVLLVLGSILTFIVYSYIPWTGVPVIGAFTTPIAGMVAMVVSLVALDVTVATNRDYLISKYPEELILIDRDIEELTRLIGGSKIWEEMVQQTQALLDQIKDSIDPYGKYDDALSASINALISYLTDPQSDSSLSPDEINRRIVTEGLPPVAKIGGSIVEGLAGGAIAGVAAQGIATNIFVQAGFWTSVKAAVGLAGGIVIGPAAFTALTVAAPIGLAAIAGAGIYHGAKTLRDEGEKRKLSAFLADVLLAALPMAWVDGNFSTAEQDVFELLLLNSEINEQDQQRIREAMNQQATLEEVLHKGILKEENPQKARMKYRLLLCTAWEIAKADGSITSDEINLHNRIAKFVNMTEEVHEIRRLVLLKSGINLQDRISVVQGDITQQTVDAIVNSTNPTLLPGSKLGWLPLPKDSSKIDTVIHRVAGMALQKECQNLNSCNVGEAKLTRGYNLPSKWIIHTVVPILGTSSNGEHELLAQCYQSCLALAHQQSICTLAFPALGTGMGKFSVEQAAKIAINEVQHFLNTHFSVEQVKFVCVDEQTYQVYVQVIKQVVGSGIIR